MRIVKCEKICLSEREREIFNEFACILEFISKESEGPDIKEIINEIESGIFDLGDYIEEQ